MPCILTELAGEALLLHLIWLGLVADGLFSGQYKSCGTLLAG